MGMASSSTLQEPESGDLCHEVKLGGPHVAVRSRVADQAASGRDPVMGPRDLPGRVVERLDPDVVRLEGEGAGGLPGRHPAELRGRVVTFIMVLATSPDASECGGIGIVYRANDNYTGRGSASVGRSLAPISAC